MLHIDFPHLKLTLQSSTWRTITYYKSYMQVFPNGANNSPQGHFGLGEIWLAQFILPQQRMGSYVFLSMWPFKAHDLSPAQIPRSSTKGSGTSRQQYKRCSDLPQQYKKLIHFACLSSALNQHQSLPTPATLKKRQSSGTNDTLRVFKELGLGYLSPTQDPWSCSSCREQLLKNTGQPKLSWYAPTWGRKASIPWLPSFLPPRKQNWGPFFPLHLLLYTEYSMHVKQQEQDSNSPSPCYFCMQQHSKPV